MSENKRAKGNGKALIWFYQVRVEDLRNMKRQQWTATYYGLLIIAAMVVGFQTLQAAFGCEVARRIVLGIGLLFNFFCLLYLKDTQSAMVRYREDITKIENHFKGDLKIVVDLREKVKRYKSFWYDWRIFIPLNLSLVVGVSFLILILYRANALYYIPCTWLILFALYRDELWEALKLGYKSLKKLLGRLRKKLTG